ncbi:thioredoxin [Jiulongibacter sp. NS-SX5]|uniref:thioredoxin n=1 Tax=Jiulongibacter sp. NS-SX5 TaxID=3463854 RepID=UPI004058374B
MKSINSKTEFENVLNGDLPVVIDFYADWCGPCQSLMPTVEKLSEDFAGKVEIQKVNIDKNSDIAAQFGIRSIPSLFFIKNEEVKNRVTGLISESILREKINDLVLAA